MTAKTATVKASDFQWETYDGETSGYGVGVAFDFEIGISARPTAKDIRWGAHDTNVRTWVVNAGDDCQQIAVGEADGVRACKTAALAAINAAIAQEI